MEKCYLFVQLFAEWLFLRQVDPYINLHMDIKLQNILRIHFSLVIYVYINQFKIGHVTVIELLWIDLIYKYRENQFNGMFRLLRIMGVTKYSLKKFTLLKISTFTCFYRSIENQVLLKLDFLFLFYKNWTEFGKSRRNPSPTKKTPLRRFSPTNSPEG